MKRTIVFFLFLSSMFTSFSQINTDRVITIGRNALHFEDYVLAISYFNMVIKQKPWLAQPYLYRAIAKLRLDDFGGAEEDCNLALQQNPFMISAYFVRGIARHSQGKLDLALEDYYKGLEFRPKDHQMMKNVAIAYIQKKEYDKAKELFNELIKSFPKDANNYLARGSLHIEAGDTVLAFADFNKAIEIDPYYAPAYGSRAILYYQIDNFQQSLTDLNEAIRLNPRDEGFYINRGLIKYHLDDLRGAMSDYDQVVAKNNTNLIARFNRGLLRFQVGDYNRAIEDFNVVISFEPDNYMAFYNRALLLSTTGSYQAAIKDFDVILEQYPNFLPGYYSRAEAKRNINDIAGAEKDLWVAMELERTHGNLPAQVAQTTQKGANESPEATADGDKKQTREEADKKNINKFNNLVVFNKDDEQKSKYQSEIRGRVQDRNVSIDLEKQFILTYYEKPGKIQETVTYNNTLTSFNNRAVLQWRLIVTNQETALNETQVQTHFTSIDNYSSKIDVNESNADYYFGRGIDYMLVQDFMEAIHNFDQAIALDPSYTLAYFNRAVVRYKQYDYEFLNTSQDELSHTISLPIGANRTIGTPVPAATPRDNRQYMLDLIIRDYTTVIQLDPSFTYAYFNRAYLRCFQRDFKAAIPDFTEAIRRNPNFAEAYFNRGLTRLSLGEAETGIADISKAGELGLINAYSIIRRMTSN